MSLLKFYYCPISGPSRAALLVIRNLKLNIQLVEIDIMKKGHMAPELLKLNPQHIYPMLDDNGFLLSESRAIATYLVNSRAPGHPLYPSDPKARAIVDSRLYFDATRLYPKIKSILVPIVSFGIKSISKENKEGLYEAFSTMDTFLKDQEWFAANHPTLADLAILSQFSTMVKCGANVAKYKNVLDWYERCESLEGFEENENGAKELGKIIKEKLGINGVWS